MLKYNLGGGGTDGGSGGGRGTDGSGFRVRVHSDTIIRVASRTWVAADFEEGYYRVRIRDQYFDKEEDVRRGGDRGVR